jgi:hypothetical protein
VLRLRELPRSHRRGTEMTQHSNVGLVLAAVSLLV